MPQNSDDDDSDWDQDDSDESPDDDFDDDDQPTIPCPYCRREILEDAERCPYCERYVSAEDAPAGRKPLWIVIGAALCLLVIVWWIAF